MSDRPQPESYRQRMERYRKKGRCCYEDPLRKNQCEGELSRSLGQWICAKHHAAERAIGRANAAQEKRKGYNEEWLRQTCQMIDSAVRRFWRKRGMKEPRWEFHRR